MSGNGVPSEGEVVCKARRRAKFHVVRTMLAVVLALMSLAAAGGFAWGMWEEVGKSPKDYRFVFARKNATVFAKWSARMARLLARLQYEEKQSFSDRQPASSESGTVVASARSRPETTSTVPVLHQPRTTDASPVPPDMDIPVVSGTDLHEPFVPKSAGTEPKATDDLPPPLPPTSVPKDPGTTAKPPRPDPKVAEVLENAHKNFDIAWKYHQKARPGAPPAGRDAANKLAIQYLKLAKQQYESVLQQKIPADLRARIQSRSREAAARDRHHDASGVQRAG